MDYSVLMSVYKNNKLNELEECFNSLLNQTVKSNDIIVVIDGPIPNELSDYLNQLSLVNSEIHIYPIEQNVGLGNALNYGISFSKNELIARMDTDDICVLDRMEKQLKCFENDSELGIVGSNIEEFIDTLDNVVGVRSVPEKHEDICLYLKKRCPFNHMTVMFKKSEVEKAEGYKDWHYNEDYYLWIRMFMKNTKFYNIQENLVHVRVGKEMYQRRGGYQYYKSEKNLFKFMYKNKIIGWFSYQKSKTIRFIVQVLMTNRMRQWFFKKFARS